MNQRDIEQAVRSEMARGHVVSVWGDEPDTNHTLSYHRIPVIGELLAIDGEGPPKTVTGVTQYPVEWGSSIEAAVHVNAMKLKEIPVPYLVGGAASALALGLGLWSHYSTRAPAKAAPAVKPAPVKSAVKDAISKVVTAVKKTTAPAAPAAAPPAPPPPAPSPAAAVPAVPTPAQAIATGQTLLGALQSGNNPTAAAVSALGALAPSLGGLAGAASNALGGVIPGGLGALGGAIPGGLPSGLGNLGAGLGSGGDAIGSAIGSAEESVTNIDTSGLGF